jgi:ATP synthase protein I
MSDGEKSAVMAVRRVLIAQALMTMMIAAGFAVLRGGPAGMSAAYGGAVTWIATAWMARSIGRAGRRVVSDVGQGGRALYGGLMQKYAFTIAALAIGLGALQLIPIPLLVGFTVTHAGFLFAAFKTPRH